ncbi:DUF6493 family protein [Streptomyces sp. NPDC059466]|uniref:DUF7824 domain-containing protein n=1 Tax=unclassified Streptomyces TaxID=2593676 RepID=UPI0036CA3376
MSSLLEAVRTGRTAEAVSLLDGMTDVERGALVPELKALRSELRGAPWDAASRRAWPTLHLAGAACQTGAAGVATWIAAADMRWAQASPAVLLDVLGDREPDWLADVTHRLARRPFATGAVPYALMAGLVRLSGCPAPTTDAYVQGWMDHVGSGWQRGDTVLDRLRKDPHLPELVAALFKVDGIGGRVEWRYGEGPNSWTYALARLTEDGVLDRTVMVDACLARLLRGGPSKELRAFLGLLTSLDLTGEERRDRLADWMALTRASAAPVAAHAQSVLASLALEGGLTPRRLAEMSSAVLFRTEKKLVRAQLVLLGKALARDPGSAAELLPAVVRALGQEDTDLQERALKIVERHAGALDGADGARESLTEAADRLGPALRARAERLLGLDALVPTPEPQKDVLPPVPERTRLAPAPASAVELAEEVRALPASGGDVAAFERILDGLVRHAYEDRARLIQALEPAVARRWWSTSEPRHPDVDTYFGEAPRGIEVVLAALLGRIRTATLHTAVRRDTTRRACRHSALADVVEARVWEVAHRLRTAEAPPFLLATPSWSTGLLEPDELVERLDAYRRLGIRPCATDFAQALLRVRRDASAPDICARDTCAPDTSVADRARSLGTAEGTRLADWLTAGEPAGPVERRRTVGVRILLEAGEHEELLGRFPPAFQRLGRPFSVFEGRSYCSHEDGSERQHWLAVAPGRPELAAARLLRDVSAAAVDDTRGTAAFLPLLAEADGEAGEAVHLCLAYGLGARHPEDRLATVDALLVLAARGRLDADRLGADLGQLVRRGAVKPARLAEAIRTAAGTGAHATVWSVLRSALPLLLADLAGAGAGGAPSRGLGDLLSVAAESAERSGARGDLVHLAQTADRRGSSKVVTQARRLRTALTQGAGA